MNIHRAHGALAIAFVVAMAFLAGSAPQGHAGARVFVGFGFPFWYPYPYPYPYGYPYAYPYPAYSPPVVVEQPPVYVQPGSFGAVSAAVLVLLPGIPGLLPLCQGMPGRLDAGRSASKSRCRAAGSFPLSATR